MPTKSNFTPEEWGRLLASPMMAGIAVAAADPIPGMAICLVQSSLVFFNIDYVRDRIRWIVDRQSPSTRWFILDGEAVTTIDSTAAGFSRRSEKSWRAAIFGSE